MAARPLSHNRYAAWYERSTHPGLILTSAIILLYASSLLGGFMLDDHRTLRVLGEYQRGLRDHPAVYEFLLGDASNDAERRAGNYAWWMADGLKYRHFRPAAAWALSAQYRFFGEHPIGYHMVSLAIYCASVLVLLRLFRVFCADEALARWAAMIFALAPSHAIPIIFMSAQCDLLALLAVTLATLLIAKFIREGGPVRLVASLVILLIGLCSKEAAFPAAAAPLVLMLLWRPSGSSGRRAILALAAWMILGTAWLILYTRHCYGTNTLAMLDPLKDPTSYLRHAPGRALIYLSSWVLIMNPFMLEMSADFYRLIWAYSLVGAIALSSIAALLWKQYRENPLLLSAALWSIMFLPVLACTPPDDRVMMLPGVGLSLLAAMWLLRNDRVTPTTDPSAPPQDLSPEPPRSMRRVPFVIFLVLQPLAALAAVGIFNFMEWEAKHHLRLMAESFERPMHDDDSIFMINTARTVESLFTQDRLHRSVGPGHVAVLSDIAHPILTRIDDHTLRIEASDRPLFSSFLGRMGTVRHQPRKVGETLTAREFTARITAVESNHVRAVELTFRDKLDSDRYRFFKSTWNLPPVRFMP